jgi:hypothetical protein
MSRLSPGGPRIVRQRCSMRGPGKSSRLSTYGVLCLRLFAIAGHSSACCLLSGWELAGANSHLMLGTNYAVRFLGCSRNGQPCRGNRGRSDHSLPSMFAGSDQANVRDAARRRLIGVIIAQRRAIGSSPQPAVWRYVGRFLEETEGPFGPGAWLLI